MKQYMALLAKAECQLRALREAIMRRQDWIDPW